MKRQHWWWLGGSLLLVLLVIAGFHLYHGVLLMARAQVASDELIIPVQRLSEFGITVKCSDACVRRSRSHVSGSLDIDYEYDNTGRTDEEHALFISSQTYADLSPLHATQTYWTYIGGIRLGLMGSDETLEIKEVPNSLSLGNQRYWARMSRAEGPIGDVVVVRQGRMVVAYMVSGLHFSTQSDIEDLMRPVLDKVAALQES